METDCRESAFFRLEPILPRILRDESPRSGFATSQLGAEAKAKQLDGKATRKLQRITEIGRRLFLFDYPVQGVGLKFVSGPEETQDIKCGSWLENWEVRDGKRVFGFGVNKGVIFSTLEDATTVQEQLKAAVDVITEIAL